MSMISDIAIQTPTMKRTGLKSDLPMKQIVRPESRKTTNIGHLLLWNQSQMADS